MEYLKDNPVTTFLLGLTLAVALVGGIVCIADPSTLSFSDYLDRLEKFALAIGILGVGHGVLGAGRQIASLPPEPANTNIRIEG